MGVTWSIAFVTRREPSASRIEQILERFGSEAIPHASLASVDLGGPPVLRDLNASLQQSLPAEVLGDAQLHNASMRIGPHEAHRIHDEMERAEVVSFELRFWGYGSPRNSTALIAHLSEVPTIKSLRASLEELVGPTEIWHMVYA